MTTWLTEEDEYKCQLSEETQRLARDELGETVAAREQAIEQLRAWVKSNDKIANCRLDANFMLRFLRARKFSVRLAGETLERYLFLRQTMALAFSNLDCTLPAVAAIIDTGYLFALPGRDACGRRVLFARPGACDAHAFTKEDVCRAHAVAIETLLEDEENQVRGLVHACDGAGVGFAHVTLFSPREAVRLARDGERTQLLRHKELHGLNAHPSLKLALDFGLSLLPEKIRRRVKIHASLSDLHKCVDPKLLPLEYGGVMPMSEMVELWKLELLAARTRLLSHDAMEVRVELFDEDEAMWAAAAARRNGRRCGSIDNGIMGVSGTFRKLELD